MKARVTISFYIFHDGSEPDKIVDAVSEGLPELLKHDILKYCFLPTVKVESDQKTNNGEEKK